MTYWRWVLLGLAAYVGLALLLRPHGDALLRAASGGTRTGAFALGLLMWAVPVVLAFAWWLRQHLHGRLPHRERRLRRRSGRVLGVAVLVSALPLVMVPVLGSRSASDTAFESSALFEPWLAGFAGGMVLLLVVLLVRRLVRAWTGLPDYG